MAQAQVPMMNMCPCPGQGLFYIGPPSPFPKPHDHWSFHDYWNKGTSSKLKGYSAFEITDGCIADSTPGSEDGQVCAMATSAAAVPLLQLGRKQLREDSR